MVWAVIFLARGFAGQGAGKSTRGGNASELRQDEIAQLARQGHGALEQGDAAGAARAYEKLVKLAPGIAEFHSNLGVSYYSGGRPREAARAFQQALKLKPGLTTAHYFLGASLAESGQCAEALPVLEKDAGRISDPRLKRAVATDGVRCAMALNQPEPAVGFLRLLEHDFPDDPDVLYMTAHVYSDLSTAASQRLLETAPGSYQAHQLNAEVLELQGKWDDAKAEYRKVLDLNPGLPGTHYHLGRLAMEGPQGATTREEARKEFEAELRIDPGNPAATYELGEMARQARQWSDAIQYFSRAVELDPGFANALIGLGKSLIPAGRAGEAVVPLERAVKLAPDDPVTHYQLSFAYRRVGRDQDAERELAAYRQAHDKALQIRQNIRSGIQGSMVQEQTAEPPE
jgi:tetratricopeptide (TPR) repeat protein